MISLGFSVDRASFNQTQKTMATVDKGLRDFASGAVLNFGKAAIAVAAFFTAANAGINHFLNGLGDQEIQMEKLSRQLWTTQQQAMAFNSTLKAMGASLQDLYLSPTLMSQYNQLHGVALQMQTPGDYNNQIKLVQSVQLQIKQMRLEAYYALQWIGYYFIKYMSGPISKVHDVLQSINQVIVKNMPTWTKRVAEVMASFVQAGIYITQALGKVWGWLQKLLQYVPGWAKGIAAALAVFGLSNPFMLFVEAIGGAILLLDDFQTYLHHGTSALGPLWSWVMKVYDALKKMGIGPKIADDIRKAFDWLGNTFQKVLGFLENLYQTFKNNGTLTQFTDNIKSLSDAVKTLGDGISTLITGIGHLFNQFSGSSKQSNMIGFFQLLANFSSAAMQSLIATIRVFGDFAKVLGYLFQFKWNAALGAAQDILKSGAQLGVMPGLPSFNAMFPGVGTGKPTYGPPSYPYMFQHASGGSTRSVTVNAPQTNYIHGGSAQANLHAQQHGYNRHLHNIRGVIR